MTRIGFAYNLKPSVDSSLPAFVGESDVVAAEEEPPSRSPAPSSRPGGAALISALAPATASAAAAAGVASDVYAEWDSPETIAAVASALSALGTVIHLEADERFPERLRRARPDIVFNIAEGLHGVNREAHVPAICEFFGVPYSGSDPFTLSLCLDKARTKEVLDYHGIPTAPFALVRHGGELEGLLGRLGVSRVASRGSARKAVRGPVRETRDATRKTPQFPLFAKPVHEGSSKGITERNFCRTPGELRDAVTFLLETYEQPVLVEQYLPGAEFTCAVLGNGAFARVLPLVGINFAALPAGALPVYGYEAKWVWDRPENPLEMFACPAPVSEALREQIERVTLAAYRVLGCRDWSRIDVRLDAAGVPHVIEVNPLPGILPDPADNSCLPKAARAAGLSYDALIQACLAAAAERQGVRL